MRAGVAMVVVLAAVACGSDSAGAYTSRPVGTYSAALALTGSYQNSQVAVECNSPSAEHIKIDLRDRYRTLRLTTVGANTVTGFGFPDYGSFTVTGTGFPNYDCGHPVTIDCSGTMGEPGQSSIYMARHGRLLHIYGDIEFLTYEVEKTGTCPDAAPLYEGQSSLYEGGSDVMSRWVRFTATASFRRVARLRRHQHIWVPIEPFEYTKPLPDIASCDHLILSPDVRSCSASFTGIHGGLLIARGRLNVSKFRPPPMKPSPLLQ